MRYGDKNNNEFMEHDCSFTGSSALNIPVHGAHRKFKVIAGTSVDATVQKEAQEKHWEIKGEFKALFDSLQDFLIIFDSSGYIQQVNPAVKDCLGYSTDDMMTMNLIEMHPPDQQEDVKTIVADISAGKTHSYQIPLMAKDGTLIPVDTKVGRCKWGGQDIFFGLFRELIHIKQAAFRKKAKEALKEGQLNLCKENIELKSSFRKSSKFGNIVGKSKAMHNVYDLILQTGASPANVIIYGESGTGKELVARSIHENSDRRDKEFVPVNCGAIPDNLIESEFFGYKKGAFTGADSDKKGFLDRADGGTLFLDEIGEIELNMQVKLLRAIEGGGYTPIGSSRVKKSDFRIIAATNKDLKDHIKKGLMRKDFFYRIHVIPICIPPLRERKEDLSLLIDHFLRTHSDGKKVPSIPGQIMEAMHEYDWPGNIRELQNVIQRYLTLDKIEFMGISPSESIESEIFADNILSNDMKEFKFRTAVENFEKKLIAGALEQNNGNKSKSARVLGIERRSLQRKIKAYGLD